MTRIILTGATSMIGIALINECLKNNIEVMGIVNPNTKRKTALPQSSHLRLAECDLNGLNRLEKIGFKADAFYHLGWMNTNKDYRNSPEHQIQNIDCSLSAMRLAKCLGCRVFIGAGSQAEYGRSSKPLSPDSPTNPENAYGIAKYASGKMLQVLSKQIGMKAIWVRIFSVYGPHDSERTLVRSSIESLLKGVEPKYTRLEQKWDYLYVEDAARALRLVGEKGSDGAVYCLGSGRALPLIKYVELIHKVTVNTPPMNIGQIDYSQEQVMYLCADRSSLSEDTGFCPEISFEDGICRTINWIREAVL